MSKTILAFDSQVVFAVQRWSVATVLGAVVLLGSIALHAQTGLQPLTSLSVVDANGKTVGTAITVDNVGTKVAFTFKNHFLILTATAQGFYGTDFYFVYQSFDCSGPAMLPSYASFLYNLPGDGSVPRTAVFGTKVYIPTGVPQPMTFNSYLTFGPGATPQCNANGSYSDNLYATQLLTDLTQFSTPFKVVAGQNQQ